MAKSKDSENPQMTTKSNPDLVVIWEEIARDGAQARILLSSEQRIKIAKLQAELLGKHAATHLVFAAGYPAICQEEQDIIREVAEQVTECQVATHGRMIKADIDLGLSLMRHVKHGRVTFAIPIAEEHSQAMLHQSNRKTLEDAVDMTKYAVDAADGIVIDVALGGSSEEDPGFLAEVVDRLAEAGAASVKICDSNGLLFPDQIREMFETVVGQMNCDIPVGTHLHNDYGLALANNLEAIKAGARMVSTSWLGLGERNGLAATEQLIFALSGDKKMVEKRFGRGYRFWREMPKLKRLVPVVEEVAKMTGVPIKETDPIVTPNLREVGQAPVQITQRQSIYTLQKKLMTIKESPPHTPSSHHYSSPSLLSS